METQILEGTFLAVQQRLSTLPLKPETHLRIIVTETEKLSAPEEIVFLNAPRRNGLILVPTKDPERQIAVALVNVLSED